MADASRVATASRRVGGSDRVVSAARMGSRSTLPPGPSGLGVLRAHGLRAAAT